MQNELYRKIIYQKISDLNSSHLKVDIEHIKSGRNNKVFKAALPSQNYLAKFYFPSKKLHRSRLNNEFSFLKALTNIGLNNIPKALYRFDDTHLAFYEFIEGESIKKEEIDKDHILCAANFFASINEFKDSDFFAKIGDASEAFKNFENYLINIDTRINTLKSSIIENNDNTEAIKFINDLILKWKDVKKDILSEKSLALPLEKEFLSPSDFGFHNCIRSKDGTLNFIDFEYAGWDDYAKFLCDFFIQPDFEIPEKYFEEFSFCALKNQRDKEALIYRAFSLLPLFRVKWCCIILNEFLPDVVERRLFSDPEFDLISKQYSQLDKAKKLIEKI